MPDSPTPLLISVHIPKSGGTSFGAALQARFGSKLMLHYQDEARDYQSAARARGEPNSALLRTKAFGLGLRDAMFSGKFNEADCIHGHFPAIRFLPLVLRRHATFATWLRDPVERTVSHYHHIYRTHPTQPVHPPIWDRIIEERWSLEKFAMSERFRNLESHFLWGVPLRLFSFVGIAEHYDEDLAWFAKIILKTESTTRRLNTNPEKAGPRYSLDPDLRQQIERFHAADMALYSRALALRQLRRT